MKKMMMLLVATMLIFTSTYLQAEEKTPTIYILGHKLEVSSTDDTVVIICLAPPNVVCVTCEAGALGSGTNVGRFYHDTDDPNSGEGYTDVDILYSQGSGGDQHEITINPGNQTISNYQDWLDYFNYASPSE